MNNKYDNILFNSIYNVFIYHKIKIKYNAASYI